MQEYVLFELSEDWYNARFGATFTESFWEDPIRRTEAYMEFDYQVATKFPAMGLGSKEPKPRPVAQDQYGHRFVPKLFGCDIVYVKDQAPAAVAMDYDFDDLAALDMPDLQNNDVFKKAMDDAKRMKEKYGFAYGWINMGSPLNTAVTAFGEGFLASCAAEPEIAQHVLMVIAKTQVRLTHEFCQVIEPSKRILPDGDGLGNCPAVMISPKLYREVILPVDLWLRQQVKNFGIHHCGKFDNYAELYTELTPTSLDVGGYSDYSIVRKYFPNVPCSYIVNPELFEGRTTEQIDKVVYDIVTAGGPLEYISHLHTYGVGRLATEQNIIDLRTSVKRQFLDKK